MLSRCFCAIPILSAHLLWGGGPIQVRYQVLAAWPHDGRAFTQGLVYSSGRLYESTGLYGRSSLRLVEPITGRVLLRRLLPHALFGEGLALVDTRLYQLTWKAGTCLIYRAGDLHKLGAQPYKGEGWGLTWDGKHLIMSDGSARLRFLKPDTLRTQRTLRVTAAGREITNLNELEYVRKHVFANIWHSDRIAVIDPASGHVRAWLDLSTLRRRLPAGSGAGVLNGIAWDKRGQRLFVTGKLWPRLFVLKLFNVP